MKLVLFVLKNKEKEVEKRKEREQLENLSAKLSSAAAPRLWPQQQATPLQ
jgi:hypothetical protein